MDPYQVLGLPQDVALADAEDAYRRLVRVHHPDLHQTNGAASAARAEQRTRVFNAAISAIRADAVALRERDLTTVTDTTGAARAADTAPMTARHPTPDGPPRHLRERARRRWVHRPLRGLRQHSPWALLPLNVTSGLALALGAGQLTHDGVFAQVVFAVTMAPTILRVITPSSNPLSKPGRITPFPGFARANYER